MSERHTFVTGFAYDNVALSALMTTLRRNRVSAHLLCPEASPSARYIAGFFRSSAALVIEDAMHAFEIGLSGLDWSQMPADGWLVCLATDSGPVSASLTRDGIVWGDEPLGAAA